MIYNFTPDQMISFMNNPKVAIAFTIIGIWSLIWKGIALWKAGQIKDKVWFVVLLVFNTFGILEIVYIYFISKRCCFVEPKKELPGKPK